MFIKIIVFPNSKKQSIKELSDKKFEVYTKSGAKNNTANKEAITLLASFLKIPSKNVRIISGHHRPHKMLEIIK